MARGDGLAVTSPAARVGPGWIAKLTLAFVAVAGVAASATSAAGDETPAAHHHDATVRHSFADVAHWVEVFDDPKRDAWQKPTEVVTILHLAPGMTVADLGAGTGYFSRHLSAAVGDTGTVFAVEVEPNLVTHLRQRAEQEKLANLVPVLGSAENPRLPAGTVDLILIVDSLHHIDDRPAYLRRLQRNLAPGGRIAIVDFKKEQSPVGPPIDHRLPREQVIEEFALAGYSLAEESSALPYQYLLIFRADVLPSRSSTMSWSYGGRCSVAAGAG